MFVNSSAIHKVNYIYIPVHGQIKETASVDNLVILQRAGSQGGCNSYNTSKRVVANLRTGLDQWTNTLTHCTQSSPQFIQV